MQRPGHSDLSPHPKELHSDPLAGLFTPFPRSGFPDTPPHTLFLRHYSTGFKGK